MAGYCTPSDVAVLNTARLSGIGKGNNPTWDDIQTYIDLTAGEIDGILLSRGYQVPVNPSDWPEAATLLRYVNARGGLAMMEEAAPQSQMADSAQKAYDAAKKMLSSGQLTVEAVIDEARAEVRAPFITYDPPQGTFDPTMEALFGHRGDGITHASPRRRQLPYFSRSMRF